MKSLFAVSLVAIFGFSTAFAQQSPKPITQSQPAPVQAPVCTPPDVWKHFHPTSSKPLAKILGRINQQIDKSTGGTLSGPSMGDIAKTLPPPCPALPPSPVPATPKQQ
jgi:hypothetical protein